MNTGPSRETEGYWHPFRPSLRWPLRIVGLLGIWGSVAMWMEKHEWSWGNFAVSLWFTAASFQTTRRRFDRRAHDLYNFVFYGLLLLLAAAVLVWAWHRK